MHRLTFITIIFASLTVLAVGTLGAADFGTKLRLSHAQKLNESLTKEY